ncbi:hypothetical protein T03_374 [Trichinella britovi]|uniref:Uncharacterized protein n=1 Tax=Trichinella britovi TaxID=45882 RepID=A0A0V0YWH7_TRIBR|nr:hypothetical protein T03_374 [Trichinella britovi]
MHGIGICCVQTPLVAFSSDHIDKRAIILIRVQCKRKRSSLNPKENNFVVYILVI